MTLFHTSNKQEENDQENIDSILTFKTNLKNIISIGKPQITEAAAI